MQRSTKRLAALLALLAGTATGPCLADMAEPAAQVPQDLVQPTVATPADTSAATADTAAHAAEPRTMAHRQLQRGRASWYAHHFHGRRTASGERYDRHALTAAHPTLPIASYARLRNPANGREVVVRINDRGPFRSGHVIDLSHAAATQLGILRGSREVEIEPLDGGARQAQAPRLVPTSLTPRARAKKPRRGVSAASHTQRRHRLTDRKTPKA